MGAQDWVVRGTALHCLLELLELLLLVGLGAASTASNGVLLVPVLGWPVGIGEVDGDGGALLGAAGTTGTGTPLVWVAYLLLLILDHCLFCVGGWYYWCWC